MLMSIEHLSKTYAVKPVLDDVSFAIEERDKIALVGINGTGKTTLLRLLNDQETSDSGTIIRKNDLRIAMLEQEPKLNDAATILEEVMASAGQSAVYEAKRILTRLGMRDLEQRCQTLSGGQKKRVALAKVLLSPSDLLILDEPTNHLDTQMITWLEQYLKRMSSALLMVTHDRYFMERICNRMMELSQGKLYLYEANYSTYIEEKEKRLALQRAQEEKRQRLLKKELEWVRAGVQARSTKSRSRLERFEALNAVNYEEVNEAIDLSFGSARLGKKTIECERIAKRYGERTLFSDFSYVFGRHDRIGIIGENGCGKTTLLRVLAKELSPDEGTITCGETIRIAYFHQGHEEMDPQQRVIDYIQQQRDSFALEGRTLDAASMLERFLFPRSVQYTPIRFLSGGEKRRLYLLKVLMEESNVLLLDEPTNDLDITTLAILEDYLDGFSGIIVTVSHDRYFLDRICDSLWIFEQGAIRTCIGGYSANMELLRTEEPSPVSRPAVRSQSLPKMSSKEKQELSGMEERIETLEAEIARLDAKMEEVSDFRELDALAQQREAIMTQMEETMERWMELSERKAAIDAMIRHA